ncbi:MAG: aldehyde dehydrogenase family protein [Polymorphobacter sp.]|uniref:aldehyde dehydrogenase family protein n=1 Tax=Polymorphobacter sp. TaxID=1909290 RepID=UPI003A8C1302
MTQIAIPSPATDVRVTLPSPAVPAAASGGADGQTLIYAATETPFAFVPHTDPGAADALAARARDAFETGPWRVMPAAGRASVMRRIGALILEHAEELAHLQTLETSIPLAQARGMHVPRTAENFGFFADMLASLSGESYEQSGAYLAIVTREPVGTALLIAPWNAPLILSSMKLAAALALGNSVIVKPSEYAPLAVLRMVELIHQAGVPEGVVQVACGPGAGIGRALVQHPDIDAIGFIGGTATGRRIMTDAAASLKKVGLELGGKSANIIHRSADIERAVDGSLMAIFAGNGEQCLAGSRILVDAPIADRFIEAFTARAAKLRIGDPFDAHTEIGPMAFKAHYDRLLAFAGTAQTDPAYKVLTGARAAPGFEAGYCFAPTVVETHDNMTELCQQELFGPFAVIQRVDDLEDAIARANQSEFGLAAYIWADDLPTVMRARRQLRAGTIWVNTPMARDLRAPFGGYKQSGIGRDGLPGSIELFTEEKSTLIPNAPLTLPKLGVGS